MKKLPSFTLQEIIVVMVITSVLVGVFYYAFRFMQRDLLFLTSTGNYNNEKQVFEAKLWSDLDGYQSVLVENKRMKIEKAQLKITYHVLGDSLVKREEINTRKTPANTTATFEISASFLKSESERNMCVFAILNSPKIKGDTLQICTPKSTQTELVRKAFKKNPH